MSATLSEDDRELVEAMDDPAFVTFMLQLSQDNELAMKFVRWALAFHVHRWHRLMHPAGEDHDP